MDKVELPQLDKVNDILKSYVDGCGINIAVSKVDMSEYFNYTIVQLKALDYEDCLSISGVLLQKSTQLQLEINRHTRTKNWAEHCIEHYIASKLGSYDKFTPYDVRKTLATQDHEYTRKLDQLIRAAQLHIDTLQYMKLSCSD